MSAPVVVYLDAKCLAKLHSDAVGHANEAVILQRNHEDRQRVVAYGSRRHPKADCSYSTIERESLAIVSCEKFRHYLLGRVVTVRIDHQSLC